MTSPSPAPPIVRFAVHSVAVEIRGEEAFALAERFDFFVDRPLTTSETEPHSVTLELVPGPFLAERQENFSYGRAPTPAAGFLFLVEEIAHFLEKDHVHSLDALGIGLPNGTSLVFLLPGPERFAFAQSLLAATPSVLLSLDHTLVTDAGTLLPYPLHRPTPTTGLVPAAPPGAVARPGERFRPGHLVIGKPGPNAVQTIPRWRASLRLMRAFGLPSIAPPSRLAAATTLLSRSTVWHFRYAGSPETHIHCLLQALASHGNT